MGVEANLEVEPLSSKYVQISSRISEGCQVLAILSNRLGVSVIETQQMAAYHREECSAQCKPERITSVATRVDFLHRQSAQKVLC